VKEFEKAQDVLQEIENPAYKHEFCYTASLCRCFIMNGKPQSALELHSKESRNLDKDESIFLLQLIGNDCYRMRHFIVAAKAFDCLREISDDIDSEPVICACVGAFQHVTLEMFQRGLLTIESEATISDILRVLKKHEGNRRAKKIISMITNWMKRNKLR